MFGAAQARRRRDQRFEHRIEIERRSADRFEDVGRRRLLLQRFLKILRPRLHLVEQPHVLDRDHRLVSESLQQPDVIRRERAWLAAGDADHPDRGAFAHQRRKQHAAIAAQAREFPVHWRHTVRLGIGKLYRLAAADQQKRREFRQRPRERSPQGFVRRGIRWGERPKVKRLANEPQHRGRVPTDQRVGAGRNRIEHRLYLGRRTGDDLEDVGGRGLPLERLVRFLEEPRVLNGDRRLIGEGLQQRPFPIGEGPRRPADHDD